MAGYVRFLLAALLVFGLAGLAQPAAAQFGKLKEKAKAKMEEKIGQKKEEATDEVPEEAGQAEEAVEAEAPADAAPAEAAKNEKLQPGQGVWVNYDFVPGERILFYDDYSDSRVGDFPRRLEFVQGNMEVAEWNGRRFIRSTDSESAFDIPLPEGLPEQFTVEFEVYPNYSWDVRLFPVIPDENGYTNYQSPASDHAYVFYHRQNGGIYAYNGAKGDAQYEEGNKDTIVKARVLADGPYMKVYANEQRVANIPNTNFGRAGKLRVYLPGTTDDPAFIGGIRIAAGGRQLLYDVLSAEGRVATQGILFDTGSDRIRPESTPTLEDIGQMLKDHADLRIAIEGHTDNVGDAAKNQELSDRRAAAVKAYLVKAYGVDAARLEAKGFGATQPAADNGTPEGRQQNRRVELVKL